MRLMVKRGWLGRWWRFMPTREAMLGVTLHCSFERLYPCNEDISTEEELLDTVDDDKFRIASVLTLLQADLCARRQDDDKLRSSSIFSRRRWLKTQNFSRLALSKDSQDHWCTKIVNKRRELSSRRSGFAKLQRHHCLVDCGGSFLQRTTYRPSSPQTSQSWAESSTSCVLTYRIIASPAHSGWHPMPLL